MRFLFLVPDFIPQGRRAQFIEWAQHRPTLRNSRTLRKLFGHPLLRTSVAWGGTLNNMRHCWIARKLGVDACLVSLSGKDTYGDTWRILDLPMTKWSERRPDDVILVPDFASDIINEVEGPVIAYMQVPIHIRADFDWCSDRVTMWTDSPFMLALCQKTFPGKEIPIVPNIVDDEVFPFIPQEHREQGLAFAFPRKGPEYIAETRRIYRERGGRYWRFELIDGVPFMELAKEMQRPQLFLASGDIEGCALPPQESMAAGIVVIGKNARGANFAMDDRKTALIANSPAEAAQCMLDAEDMELRKSIAKAAHDQISRYFPHNEPTAFWKQNLIDFGARQPD
ncbi:MAG: glycosyltransferase [Deltaproteobacteria bacterium]|nr:glycosyltransferase [Deltaproteobacteria bacterium]